MMRVLLIAFAVLGSGCAPLQQAPLVYSSKVTVGIDISTPTSESPGASISVGFKAVDAAYVPIAVSKDSKTRDGSSENFDIVKIEAVFGEGTGGAKIDELGEENKKKITRYLTASQEREESNKKIIELNAKMKEVPKVQKQAADELNQKGLALRNLRVDEEERRKEIWEDAAIAQRKFDAAVELPEKLKLQIAEETNRYQSLKLEAEKLFNEAAQAASLIRTDKRDALSVYGRFDSKSDAKTQVPSAQLTAGKIFSTGVASQNLTEAAKTEAEYAHRSNCIEQYFKMVEKISEEGKKETALSKLPQTCGPVKGW